MGREHAAPAPTLPGEGLCSSVKLGCQARHRRATGHPDNERTERPAVGSVQPTREREVVRPRVGHARDPEVGGAIAGWTAKHPRGHADHRERHAVDEHGSSERGGIRREEGLREPLGQDQDGLAARRAVLIRAEGASGGQSHAKNLEEIGRNRLARCLSWRLTLDRQAGVELLVSRNGGDRRCAAGDVGQIDVREKRGTDPAVLIRRAENVVDQSVLVRDAGYRSEKQRVGQAEDGRRRSQAKGERDDDRGGNERVRAQASSRVAQVLPQGGRERPPALALDAGEGHGRRRLDARDTSSEHVVIFEFAPCATLRVNRGMARSQETPVAVLEMLGDLIRDLRLAFRPQLYARESTANLEAPVRHVRLP
jgi:hypothetical protein